MTTDEKAERVNALAIDICESMEAGAVVVLVLVRGDQSGEPAMLCGTTGGPRTMKFLADRMHGIGELMGRAAACGGTEYKETARVKRTPPLGRG